MSRAELSKGNFPLDMQEALFVDLSPINQEKILKAYQCLTMDTKVIYIVGDSSLEKNKMLGLLAKYLLYKEKGSISLVNTPSWDTTWQDTDNYVILNATSVSPRYIDSIREMLFFKLSKGSIIVIDASSLDAFMELYKEDLVKYALPKSVVIEFINSPVELTII